ncbi:MAG TPA: serine/threonine-protein kinase [Pseudonocardiaceae bacterium]
MSERQGAPLAGSYVLAQRYELGELVGRGGMAEVYRAHDQLLERAVAVKIFRPHTDLAARRRFDDEARALARLAHPGLVSIFDVDTFDDRPFLVMEFVEGTSLQARLLDGPWSPHQVMRIGCVLAEALAHAHGRGVVHRDVKPSNIMLDRDELPHLTDFGIALLAGAPRLTGAYEIIGTPAYLAPEQLSGGEVGPPADVYALALVLLECLTGEVEYPSGSSLEVALTRLNRPPRIPTGLPPTLANLLIAMTSTEALDRPAAAECALRLSGPSDILGPALPPEQDIIGPALPPEQSVAMPLAADESAAWWADVDRTVRSSAHTAPDPTRSARAGVRWRALAASVTGIAAVVVALVLLLNTQQPPIGRPLTGAGHAQSGAGAGASTDRPGAAGGGPGRADGSGGTVGTLVANQHPVPANSAAAPPAAVSSTSADSLSAQATTSSQTASAPATTTTSSESPTTSNSSAPVPTSTNGAAGDGTSNTVGRDAPSP